MKQYISKIGIIFVLFVFIIVFSNLILAEPENIGEITFIIGQGKDVQIQHHSDEWNDAEMGQKVYESDKIRTAKESRCEVTLTDNSLVRIGEESEFVFTSVAIQENSSKSKSELLKGKIWLNINPITNKKSGFQVKTPTAVCAVRGTIFRIDSDQSTTCSVYQGAVDVGPNSYWNPVANVPQTHSLKPVEVPGPYEIPPPFEVTLEEWVRIVQGFQVTVRADGKFAKSKIDEEVDEALDWVKWNQERDESIK